MTVRQCLLPVLVMDAEVMMSSSRETNSTNTELPVLGHTALSPFRHSTLWLELWQQYVAGCAGQAYYY